MKKQVVIVGAGFGGLWAARKLAHANVEVTVIDRNNYHAFLPLLYQVAAAELEEERIAYPVRSVLSKHPNMNFLMSNVTRVDFVGKTVYMGERTLEYDYLVLALGSTYHFFNVPGADKYALPLKTVEQATTLRNRILSRFEQANLVTDPAERKALLTFTIVGGGPTGVEFAGALRELINKPLQRDFPKLDMSEVSVVLVEGMDRVLSMFPEKLGSYTGKRLKKMGVDIITERFVTEVKGHSVTLNDGSLIPTRTVVWTAGVKGAEPREGWDLETQGARRVIVDKALNVKGLPDVYAVGDMAYFEQDGKQLPMLAQVAMQQGEHAAHNIIQKLHGVEQVEFEYVDKGSMATIGRNAAVAQVGNFSFTGVFAWLLWLFIHVAYLIGFRNRLVVLINWAWDYFFFERIARIIVAKPQFGADYAPGAVEPVTI